MRTLGFWLRWSWRDLRERWLHVVAIALIIALSTGVYVGLSSTTPWRAESLRASYARLHTHDLRINLTTGSFVPARDLLAAVQSIPHANRITAAEPRLIVPTTVSVQTDHEPVLVRGRLIGVDVADGGPHVDELSTEAGRALTPADSGQNVGLIEYHFADYYDLPPQSQITLSGGVPLAIVGQTLTPDYFMVMTEEGGVWAQASFAAVFVPLNTAQTIAGHPGLANDLVLTLAAPADRDRVRAELDTALRAAFPSVSTTITVPSDDPVYTLMHQSIDMNQRIYNMMIVLFMAGAMFSAFNLSSRMIDAQRRQIGIGMALGTPPRLLALRPLLVGAQIALLGALFGIVIGWLVGRITEVWVAGLMPLPVMTRLFRVRTFFEAAALGFVLPFLATVLPVWRALRVPPIDAIRPGHLAVRGSRLSRRVTALPLPGRSFVQMPLRNLLRAPRHTLLTVLGVAAAITTLIGLTGLLDSVLDSLDNIQREMLQDHPDRLLVFLDGFYPADSPRVTQIAAAPELSTSTAAIRVPGKALHGDVTFDVSINVLDLDNPLWTPTITTGTRHGSGVRPGVLISVEAASDLGIGVGDTFILEHVRREGVLAFRTVQTEVEVIGLHADPYRMPVYLSRDQAGVFGLDEQTNVLHVYPASDVSLRDARNAMFSYPGVASVTAVRDMIESLEWVLDEAIRFLSGVELAVLVLAFLVAFNSTSINLNERAREIATLFAFGLPVRTVARMAMLENLITGILGTLLGMGLGVLFLLWFLSAQMSVIMPVLRMQPRLSPLTLALAVLTGVVVVALTPLLTVRRLRALDIPSTLRVME